MSRETKEGVYIITDGELKIIALITIRKVFSFSGISFCLSAVCSAKIPSRLVKVDEKVSVP